MSADLPPPDSDATPRDGAPSLPDVRPGASIGRYIILSLLGSGGMGAVYAAHDPELDRKVAVKLLQPGAGWVDGVRMLREAQALARLAHPNVVSVHDVGPFEMGVFIAMEFVEGVTLSRWIAQRQRSWREILDVFLAAGRGLAAAHRANLVHRDFKPDNLMVGADGRVRVMDFGLACTDRAQPGELVDTQPMRTQHISQSNPAGPVMDVRLTRDGALLGTPSYMAPEQWKGATAHARTDQFSFCVALWEALYGEHPFAGPTIHALMLAVTAGKQNPPTRPNRAPAWFRRVLERGLSLSPDHRFRTIDELLVALERGHARSRARRLLLGASLVAAVTAGALAWRTHRSAACEAAGAEMDGVWNDQARHDLRAALAATGVSYAATSYDRAVPRIDAWARTWQAARVEVCREATIDGTRSPDLYTRSTACLDEQRDGLAGLLDVLRNSQATDVQRVVPAVASLPPIDPCRERSALERRPAPPDDPQVRAAADVLRRDLRRVHGQLAAGRFAEGLTVAEGLLIDAEALGYRPLEVEARALVGVLATRAERHADAEAALKRVYLDAGALGDDERAAHAAVQLVSTIGVDRSRPAEGLEWSLAAEMLIRRLDESDGLLGASLRNSLAMVHNGRGAYAEALALHGQAREIRERVLGPLHPEIAATLNNLASAQRARGDYAAALASHEQALAIREQALGPDHPDVATTLNNLGLTHQTLGTYEAAEKFLARARAVREAAFPADHPDVATTLHNLGHLELLRGRHDAAQPLLRRALAIREALGPEHRDVATSLGSLGLLHQARGDLDAAAAAFDRALAIREKALGPDHPGVATSLAQLGAVHQQRGDLDRALALHARVLEIRRSGAKALPEGHPDIARALHQLAAVHHQRGDHTRAHALVREALTRWEQALGPDHPDGVPILHTLGQVHVALGDRAAARTVLDRALRLALASLGASHPLTTASRAHLAAVDPPA